MNATRFVWLMMAGLLGTAALMAQDTFDSYGPKPTGAAAAQARYEKQRAAHGDDPDKLVLPGLIADRQARTVELLTEATGLDAEEVVEFLLVDQQSGHGYEALLWSFAKPSDVHRALEFIGLKPGSPINPAAGRFWPDGDPVTVVVDDEGNLEFPIEELILDTQTGEPLPAEGFVFAGSRTVYPPGGDGTVQYAADVYEPRSIASIYNEPAVVLDVPRQVSQGEVYGSQVVNPERTLRGGELLTVILRPGATDGRPRGQQLQLAVRSADGATGLSFRLSDSDGEIMAENPEMTPVLETLVGSKQQGAAPYVTLVFGDEVPVLEASRTCILMAMLETMGSVRVNPPAAGQLIYRAFVPARAWQEPSGRPVQPWELHLVRTNEHVSAELVWHEPVEATDHAPATFRRRAYPVADPAGLQERFALDARERQEAGRSAAPGVLLVYPGPRVTYGQLLKFVGPVLDTHRTIYIFAGENEP